MMQKCSRKFWHNGITDSQSLPWGRKLRKKYVGLDEAQAGIKTAKKEINNLRYADGTILMAENKEELKSLLMKVKVESEKAGLKLNTQKTKIMASSPISSVQFSLSVVSDYLQPHELQHARPPYSSPTPEVHSNSCPSSR